MLFCAGHSAFWEKQNKGGLSEPAGRAKVKKVKITSNAKVKPNQVQSKIRTGMSIQVLNFLSN